MQQNKTVVITGASSGIGHATAMLFQRNGWNVVATMRSPEKETALNTIDHVLCTALDVTKPETIRTAVDAAISTFGKIDVVATISINRWQKFVVVRKC